MVNVQTETSSPVELEITSISNDSAHHYLHPMPMEGVVSFLNEEMDSGVIACRRLECMPLSQTGK